MDLLLLGAVDAIVEGVRVNLGGRRQRAVLADLALHAGVAVPTARLVDDIWGEAAPAAATHTVQAYVFELRRILAVPGEHRALITRGAGYLLDIDPARVDALRFAQLTGSGRAALELGDLAGAEARLSAALALWRGPALDDLRDTPFAVVAGRRLDDQRVAARELLFDARLALGRHAELVSELERAIAEHPLRERTHGQLMVALYRSGRQADALAAYQGVRRLLITRRGIEPGPELRALEQSILAQSPALDLGRAVPTADGVPPPRTRAGQPTDPRPVEPQPLDVRPVEPQPLDVRPVEPERVDVRPVEPQPVDPAAEPQPADPGRATFPEDTQPSRGRHRGRLTWMALAAAVVLIAALTLPRFDQPTSARPAVQALGVSEVAPNDTIAASLAIPGPPGGAAAAAGSVWVTSPESHALYRIDPGGRARRATIGVGAGAGAIVAVGTDLWVANTLDGTLSEVDTRTDAVVRTVAVGPEPTGLAVGPGTVWVADSAASTLSAVDDATGRVTSTRSLSSPPFGVAFGAGYVWLTSQSGDHVTRVAPGGGPEIQVAVGSGPTAIAFALGSVWVANSLDSTVSRIDPTTDAVSATIPVGDGPDSLAFVGNAVWAGNRLSSTMTRIDPATDAATASVALGASPVALTTASGGVWTATQPTLAAIARGGTLRALSSVPVPSIDPTRIYPTFSPQFWQGTYDTLVTFQRVGGAAGLQLVPDLALAMPTVTGGGTVYSFTLRPGLRYSDGTAVLPEDFRYGIERLMNLDPSAASFLTGIVGGANCRAGISCDLSRGITVSDAEATITFRLSSPDADFLDKLTFVGTAPVPSTVTGHDVGAHPVPATGPYMISRYVPGKEVDFIRNPLFHEWSAAAEPAGAPDRIEWTFGASIPQEVAAIAAGRADWTYDLLTDAETLATRYPRQVHVNPNFGLTFASFDTRVAPFDDLRVRQAFSLAADRSRLVTLLGGADAATPTCQILPPGIPGYQPYCPFTADRTAGGTWVRPDLPAARRLVAESGTAGMRVTVVTNPDVGSVVTGFIVSVLRELGYRASMVSPRPADFSAIVNDTRRRHQADDGNWFADYPSASNFFDLFFRCSSFRVADPADTRNGSFFCDPALDRLMQAADTAKATDPAAAAATWAAVDRRVTTAAPWVPLVNTTFVDFLSPRVSDYQYNPAFGVVLDQLTVSQS